ncbi:MAG: cytochrome c oxidase assembly protein [Gemmatimonadota bacterium]|jgi:putative membrane protein
MQWWCVATGQPWTWEWRAYPGVWLFVGALALFYWLRVARPGGGMRPSAGEGSAGAGGVAAADGDGAPGSRGRGRPWAFYTGLLLLWAALDWPIGALGAGYLASVHMVQFLLIAMVVPPFLLLGVPEATWRRWAGAGGAPLRAATHPVVTLAAFTVLVGLTHWPLVVDGLMASQLGSFLLDGTWLGAGLLFWWPVLAPESLRPWFGAPARMGYLIAATILNTGVFAYLTFTELPVYATYELAPPVGALSTRDDQIVAGLLMKMGGAVVLWTAITVLFFRWFAREEREMRGEAGP